MCHQCPTVGDLVNWCFRCVRCHCNNNSNNGNNQSCRVGCSCQKQSIH